MSFSLHGNIMIGNAKTFATAAHGAINQRRKYTGDPYIVHPTRVAAMVASCHSPTWQMIAAAWLHDTIEDTSVTSDMIREIFGDMVAEGVMALTNVHASMGNRAARFALNLERLSVAPDWVKTVKIADLYDNTSSIVQHDPKFARLYLQEKRATMDLLQGGDFVLWHETWNLLEQSEARLKELRL